MKQARIKIAGRNNNLRYADDTILMAESKEELKRLLKVKEGSEKAGLKFIIQKTKIMASGPITACVENWWGKKWKQWQILLSWAPKSLQIVTEAMKLKDTCSLEETYDKPRQHIKKQRFYFVDKGPYSPTYGFSSIHVWMWEFDHKECRVLKNWCFQTSVLEKTLKSPLDCKEIKPVNPKGNQSWLFIVRTDAEASVLWPPYGKSRLIGKDPDAGKAEGMRRRER